MLIIIHIDEANDESDDDDAGDEDEKEKCLEAWYFSAANKNGKNEIGANVYGYWQC